MRFLLKRLIAIPLVGACFALLQNDATASSTGSVTLFWNPSLSTNTVSYNIYYGTTSGVYTNTISIVDSTNLTITGLVVGSTYYFAATAVNTSGQQSQLSNETSYLIPTNSVQSTNSVQFAASRTNGASLLSVEFEGPTNDSAGNTIKSWKWNFGDGSTGSGQKPLHTYTNTETYYPVLTVTNALEQSLSCSNTAIVVTNPSVVFSANLTNPCPHLSIQFKAATEDSGGNPIAHWYWKFGDGTFSASQNPSHVYASLGTFQPELSATNKYGVLVVGAGPAINVSNPALQFTASRTNDVSRFTVRFKSSRKDSDGVTVKDWHWSFGDGTTGTGPDPSHTYTNLTTYHPVLTVTNLLGQYPVCSGPAITVTNPEIKFKASSTNGYIPLTVKFECPSVDSGANIIKNWLWKFGDGTISTARNPSHVYTNTGTFNVVLIVTNKFGLSPTCSGKVISAKTKEADAIRSNIVVVNSPPQLLLAFDAGMVTLTWPTNATVYTLQFTTNAAPPFCWMSVTSPPVIINGQNTVTNTVSGTRMFFRLTQ